MSAALTAAERESLMDACPLAITPTIADHDELFTVVEAIIAARAEGAERRAEWGVERTEGAVGTVINFEGSRRGAESCAANLNGHLVRRIVSYSTWERDA